MAPDAVIGLVERAGKIRSGICQGEAVAPTNMVERMDGIAPARICLHRNQSKGIDTLGRLEEDAAAVAPASLVGVGGPGAEALREREVGGGERANEFAVEPGEAGDGIEIFEAEPEGEAQAGCGGRHRLRE